MTRRLSQWYLEFPQLYFLTVCNRYSLSQRQVFRVWLLRNPSESMQKPLLLVLGLARGRVGAAEWRLPHRKGSYRCSIDLTPRHQILLLPILRCSSFWQETILVRGSTPHPFLPSVALPMWPP